MYVTEQFVQSVHMTAQDRRITKTRKAIYNAFLQLLNQKNYEAITVQEIIDLAENMKRDEIADLSKVFTKGLEEKDSYCESLLEEIAYESALVIDSIIKGLDFDNEVKVSYSGGVFNLGDKLISKIEEKSQNKIKILEPYTNPSEGALILAKMNKDLQ